MYLSNSTSTFSSLGCDLGEDRISELPDDILLTFLSPMGMKEAAKTSILSKRWRYLWAKRTHLDFDPDHLDLDYLDLNNLESVDKGKYINWVNQVVDLHCSPSIDTFRIVFRFNSCDTHHFDRWVKFALSRKVKNLELTSRSSCVVYTLGFDILNPSVGIGDSGITSLTSLHLDGVDVTGDFVEYLLLKCAHLERLYVEHSGLLVRLKVIGLSLKLKELTIRSCGNLKELEIDVVNLIYFDYVGNKNLVLKSMPRLVEASFGGTCFGCPVSIFQQISHIAAHIHKLSLNTEYYKFHAGAFPTFCNLKQLNVVVDCFQSDDDDDITRLLDACPALQELKLEVFWYICSVATESYLLVKMDMLSGEGFDVDLDDFEPQHTQRNTHPNLKVLEVVNYSGCYYDINIILSVVHFACNLETIICDPNSSDSCYRTDKVVETLRARAYKLQKFMPRKISAVIL